MRLQSISTFQTHAAADICAVLSFLQIANIQPTHHQSHTHTLCLLINQLPSNMTFLVIIHVFLNLDIPHTL